MSSFFHKGIFSIFLSGIVVSTVLYASPPPAPPGIPAGGKFSQYFLNIIQGGTSGGDGVCNDGGVIIGFLTGSTSAYGLPICKTLSELGGVSVDMSALSGTINTISGMIAGINPNQWLNFPTNLYPTGIYYPIGNVGIGTLPDVSKKLTVVGDTTLSGSVTLPKLPISSTDATNKAYVDAAVVSAAGGRGGGCYYSTTNGSNYGPTDSCLEGYTKAPGVYVSTSSPNGMIIHAICCPSSTNNADLNYCPAYTTTRMIGSYVYTYTVPDTLKGTTRSVYGYRSGSYDWSTEYNFTCE